MKNLTCRKNGAISVSMEPECSIDSAILEAMAQRFANNPAALKMSFENGVATFSVETK